MWLFEGTIIQATYTMQKKQTKQPNKTKDKNKQQQNLA